jgi:hypothetical protein
LLSLDITVPTILDNEVSGIDRIFTEAQTNGGGFKFLHTLVRIDVRQCWDGYEGEFLGFSYT